MTDSLSPDAKKCLNKWSEIIKDYEANVTHIYGRELIHMLFDVVMHSALSFKFMGQPVQRGWVEALIAGDTKCGKSATSTALARHCQISPPVQCERASMPGVLGGILQEGGGRQSVVWGAIPRQDKRAVILEEITGLKVDEISQMSDCRSSGIASINKIQAERTMARTRKLWLSNPRTDHNRKMQTYMYGVSVVPEIMGKAEDISRFDIATGVSAEEVPVEVLNSEDHETVPHQFHSEAAHTLIFWAWTRKPEQIVFAEGVEHLILVVATEMSKTYSSQIPLVEPGEQRLRVARVAISIAARFHSTSDGETLLVGKPHVEVAAWLFRQCYDRPAFNYLGYSGGRQHMENLTEEDYAAFSDAIRSAGNHKAIVRILETGSDLSRIPVIHHNDLPKFLGQMVELGMAEMGERGRLGSSQKLALFLARYKNDKSPVAGI